MSYAYEESIESGLNISENEYGLLTYFTIAQSAFCTETRYVLVFTHTHRHIYGRLGGLEPENSVRKDKHSAEKRK